MRINAYGRMSLHSYQLSIPLYSDLLVKLFLNVGCCKHQKIRYQPQSKIEILPQMQSSMKSIKSCWRTTRFPSKDVGEPGSGRVGSFKKNQRREKLVKTVTRLTTSSRICQRLRVSLGKSIYQTCGIHLLSCSVHLWGVVTNVTSSKCGFE